MIENVSLNSRLRVAGPDLSGTTQVAAGADFSQVLSDVVKGSADTLRAGEAAAISGMRGQMPVQDVVEAVMSAERALQTALALRDKSVAAWQEISRMSI